MPPRYTNRHIDTDAHAFSARDNGPATRNHAHTKPTTPFSGCLSPYLEYCFCGIKIHTRSRLRVPLDKGIAESQWFDTSVFFLKLKESKKVDFSDFGVCRMCSNEGVHA